MVIAAELIADAIDRCVECGPRARWNHERSTMSERGPPYRPCIVREGARHGSPAAAPERSKILFLIQLSPRGFAGPSHTDFLNNRPLIAGLVRHGSSAACQFMSTVSVRSCTRAGGRGQRQDAAVRRDVVRIWVHASRIHQSHHDGRRAELHRGPDEPDRNGHQPAVRGSIQQLPAAWAPPRIRAAARSTPSVEWPRQGSSARTRRRVQFRST